MHGEERRNLIIARLQSVKGPISATSLAKEFSVTRQIIVADIALLRAAGHSIRAEHRGYVLSDANSLGGICKRIVVKHGKNDVREEFYAVVDNGGKVLDVIVEHSIYGTISVKLDIFTRYDADTFVSKIQETGANPLSLLTEGLHVHTISVPDEESFSRIVKKLKDLEIYIESN
ncbi:MAG: transcription repressor NadR [Clostridia bacterium]|nr:transcription repressor NadR [Clostridia bacterium]